jgi:hypothetical protein
VEFGHAPLELEPVIVVEVHPGRFVVRLTLAARLPLPVTLFGLLVVLSAAGLVFLTGWWPHHRIGPAP